MYYLHTLYNLTCAPRKWLLQTGQAPGQVTCSPLPCRLFPVLTFSKRVPMLAVTINSRFRAYWSAILPLLLSRSPASGLHTQVAEVRRNDCFSNSRSTTAQLRTCFISAPQRTLEPCHDAEAFAEHLGYLTSGGRRLFGGLGAARVI